MTIIPAGEFDWCDDAVVLREQPATAVYVNQRGEVVIRQERAWDEDSDTLVILQAENVEAITLALTDAATYAITNRPTILRDRLAEHEADKVGHVANFEPAATTTKRRKPPAAIAPMLALIEPNGGAS